MDERMKTLFLVLLLIHGSIHLLGFLKAFRGSEVGQPTRSVSKPTGVTWLIAAGLFLGAAAALMLDRSSWWVSCAGALLVSQALIVRSWTDAKYGTVLNMIILVPVLVSFAGDRPSSYRHRFRDQVEARLHPITDAALVSSEDLRPLPSLVQRYLKYAGVVGKPKVQNFRAVFRGTMRRSPEGGWMEITSEQYNFFGDAARLFYIRSALFGIPFDGLHAYLGDSAIMQISVASMVRVVDAKGPEMTRGETVTMFNDMCLMAPATLIDRSIQWEGVDSSRVRATFTNKGVTITAILTVNDSGQLIDFVSPDRYYSTDGTTYTNYPWSTPVRGYKALGERNVPAEAEAVWDRPEGAYLYARFTLIAIEYNCEAFK